VTGKKSYKSKSDLNAIEEQTLLYARDLAKMFMERKEKERQLNLTKQQLAQSAKIALLGELAAGIAHEINNTLTPAVGNLSILLLDRNNFSEKVARRLELTEESIMRASSMLQQILDFSRKKPEKRQLVDISTILERSLFLLKYKFTKNQIRLEKDLQSELSKIQADDTQIEQVFTNLILNAIDAMEAEGKLLISAKLIDDGGKSVLVEVEDDGCGIDEKDMSHLFNPFFTRKKYGTGLGLTQVKKIIDLHRGALTILSKAGEGTRVMVTLPIEQEQEQENGERSQS